jgi:hypothetical protein
MPWGGLLAAAAMPTVANVDVVVKITQVILSPGGAVAILVVLLGALLYRRMIPRGTHDAEMAAVKESYEKALADRDRSIEKLERRAERWEQYALFGRQTLKATLDEVGAPAPQEVRKDG